MFVKVVVTVLVVVVGSAWAQVFSGSGCPTVQTKPTFDLNRVSFSVLYSRISICFANSTLGLSGNSVLTRDDFV